MVRNDVIFFISEGVVRPPSKFLILIERTIKMDNEEKGYGKIVDDLTIDDLKKYEEAGISILLVRNPLTAEVSEAVSKSKIHVYADLDPKTINIARDLIAAAGGNSNE
jgi:predicted amino acid racemase